MEQLKVILGHVRKQHFWILCVVVVILGLIGWYRGTSSMASQYVTQLSSIKEKFQKVGTVASNPSPPNEHWKAGVDQLAQKQRQEVKTTWDTVYAEQTEKVLKWPTDLGKSFLDWIHEHPNPTDEIPRKLRERYQNYIRDEFPGLLEIVKARNLSETSRQAGVAAGPRRPQVNNPPRRQVRAPMNAEALAEGAADDEYIVEWQSQGDVAAALDLQQTPTSQQLRNLQEDLWVYRTLLNIIAAVNERATGRYNAKIKVINRIDIGPAAAQASAQGAASGKIFVPAAGAGSSPAPAAPPAMIAPPPAAAAPGAADAASSDDGRYVDEQGKPMGTSTAQQGEFKRMPVYLDLVMDQREIHTLLAACANSPLPVEVRQLRVRSLMESGGSPGGRSGGLAGFGGGGNFNAGGGGGNTAGRHSGADQDQSANDVSVELHGIIYIFNPPDIAKLGASADAAAGGGNAPAVNGQPVPNPAAAGVPAADAAPAPAAGPPGTEQQPAAPNPAPQPAAPPASGQVPGAAPGGAAAPQNAPGPAPQGQPATP